MRCRGGSGIEEGMLDRDGLECGGCGEGGLDDGDGV
jgi:hypothetical protein